jgi:hypothetical protein
MHDVRVRACNRSAALHGSRFAPMCSALIFRHRPYNSKAMTSWKLLSSRMEGLIQWSAFGCCRVVT